MLTTIRNLERGTFISIGWCIQSFIHSVLGCRDITDNFLILSSEADQLEPDQLDLLLHVVIHCFLPVIRVNRIHVVVIKVRHKLRYEISYVKYDI